MHACEESLETRLGLADPTNTVMSNCLCSYLIVLLPIYIQLLHAHYTHIIIYTVGFAGWGIAWFINGTLIPELVVQRGSTYTFIVYGGDDPSDAGNYHPFYITNSRMGGRLLNPQEEKDVSHITCV